MKIEMRDGRGGHSLDITVTGYRGVLAWLAAWILIVACEIAWGLAIVRKAWELF